MKLVSKSGRAAGGGMRHYDGSRPCCSWIVRRTFIISTTPSIVTRKITSTSIKVSLHFIQLIQASKSEVLESEGLKWVRRGIGSHSLWDSTGAHKQAGNCRSRISFSGVWPSVYWSLVTGGHGHGRTAGN